jgi:hypothetical protein
MLREATWVIASAAAVYNLLAFLHSFTLRNIKLRILNTSGPKRIEIVGLGLLEKSNGFHSDASNLISRCPGIEEIRLLIDIRKVSLTRQDGYPMLDIYALSATHEIGNLANLRGLRVVMIGFLPFMNLRRLLGGLRGEKLWAQRLRTEMGDPTELVGIESFWGLRCWLEKQSEQVDGGLRVCVESPEGS